MGTHRKDRAKIQAQVTEPQADALEALAWLRERPVADLVRLAIKRFLDEQSAEIMKAQKLRGMR